MCNPYFHEFRVIPPANGIQLVCYTVTLFTTEDVDKRVDPDRRLTHLSRLKGAGGHVLFSDVCFAGSRLLGQTPLSGEPLTAAGK